MTTIHLPQGTQCRSSSSQNTNPKSLAPDLFYKDRLKRLQLLRRCGLVPFTRGRRSRAGRIPKSSSPMPYAFTFFISVLSLSSEILRRRRAQQISPGSSSLASSSPSLPNEIFTPLNVYPVESFFYSTGAFAFIQLGRSIFHRGGISRSEPTAGGIPPGSSSLS